MHALISDMLLLLETIAPQWPNKPNFALFELPVKISKKVSKMSTYRAIIVAPDERFRFPTCWSV